MEDLTIIYLTVNKVPKQWVKYHKNILLKAIGNTQIITISKEPMNWGVNIIQDKPICPSNVYYQMLRGAKMVKTPYLAIAEDDALYPKEHFKFRPKLDEFGYNMNRWGLFTWSKPTYHKTGRALNSTLIAPTELTVKALEERFDKYPNGTSEGKTGELGVSHIEVRLGLPHYKSTIFNSIIPVIDFNHIYSMDPWQQNYRKRMGPKRVFDLPYWGKAEELVKHFK